MFKVGDLVVVEGWPGGDIFPVGEVIDVRAKSPYPIRVAFSSLDIDDIDSIRVTLDGKLQTEQHRTPGFERTKIRKATKLDHILRGLF